MKILKYKKEIRIGLVFIIAAAILIWGLMYLKGVDLLHKKRTLYALYDHVSGLEPTSHVFIKGLKIGQVQDIYFSKELPGKIIVKLYITDEYPIPLNSVARIQSSDLLGSKQVEIVPGDSSVLVENYDTLRARTEATLSEEVNRQLLPLKRKAENLISSIDTVATIMQQVLNKNTRENLVQSIENIRKAIENITSTTNNLDTLVGTQRKNIVGIISNIESISRNLRQNNDEISNVIRNISDISDSLAKARIPYTFNQVTQVVESLNKVLQKINSGQGSLGLLVNDPKLYKEVEKAARDLNLLLEDIKANPKKYVKVTVF